MGKIMISHREKYSFSLRALAVFTTLAFTINSAIVTPSALAQMIVIGSGGEISGETSFSVPSEIGSVNDYFVPSIASNQGFVVHIQDAHANPDAQQKIKALLNYFLEHSQKDKPFTVALEGAANDLHLEYLNFFSDYPEVNQAIIQDLAAKGELTGAELFAWEHFQKDKDQKIAVVGAEETGVYRENLKNYLTVLNRHDEIETSLTAWRETFEIAKSKIFSPELRKFIQERDRRKHGDYSQGDFNGNAIDSPQLAVYLKYLAEQANSQLQIDLNDRFEQVRFPNLVRVLVLDQIQKAVDAAKAEKEKSEIIDLLKKRNIQAQVINSLEQLPFDQNPRAALETIWESAINSKVSLESYKDFWQWAGSEVLRKEIQAPGLFQEMAQIENWLIGKLAINEEEQDLIALIDDFTVFEKLLNLHLTRDDYLNLQERKDSIFDAVVGARFEDLTQRITDERSKPKKISEETIAQLKKIAEQGIEFYRGAEERDLILTQNVSKLMTQGNPPVLISGGFHSFGVTHLMRASQMGYAVVQPKITSPDGSEFYPKVLRGDHADLSAYFDQPYLNIQESLFLKALLEIAVPVLWEKYQMPHSKIGFVVADAINRHPVLSNRITASAEELASGSRLQLQIVPTQQADISANNPSAFIPEAEELAATARTNGVVQFTALSGDDRVPVDAGGVTTVVDFKPAGVEVISAVQRGQTRREFLGKSLAASAAALVSLKAPAAIAPINVGRSISVKPGDDIRKAIKEAGENGTLNFEPGIHALKAEGPFPGQFTLKPLAGQTWIGTGAEGDNRTTLRRKDGTGSLILIENVPNVTIRGMRILDNSPSNREGAIKISGTPLTTLDNVHVRLEIVIGSRNPTINVENSQVTILNSAIRGNQPVLMSGSNSSLIDGSKLISNNGPALEVTNSDHLTVTGGTILKTFREDANQALFLRDVTDSVFDNIAALGRVQFHASSNNTIRNSVLTRYPTISTIPSADVVNFYYGSSNNTLDNVQVIIPSEAVRPELQGQYQLTGGVQTKERTYEGAYEPSVGNIIRNSRIEMKPSDLPDLAYRVWGDPTSPIQLENVTLDGPVGGNVIIASDVQRSESRREVIEQIKTEVRAIIVDPANDFKNREGDEGIGKVVFEKLKDTLKRIDLGGINFESVKSPYDRQILLHLRGIHEYGRSVRLRDNADLLDDAASRLIGLFTEFETEEDYQSFLATVLTGEEDQLSEAEVARNENLEWRLLPQIALEGTEVLREALAETETRSESRPPARSDREARRAGEAGDIPKTPETSADRQERKLLELRIMISTYFDNDIDQAIIEAIRLKVQDLERRIAQKSVSAGDVLKEISDIQTEAVRTKLRNLKLGTKTTGTVSRPITPATLFDMQHVAVEQEVDLDQGLRKLRRHWASLLGVIASQAGDPTVTEEASRLQTLLEQYTLRPTEVAEVVTAREYIKTHGANLRSESREGVNERRKGRLQEYRLVLDIYFSGTERAAILAQIQSQNLDIFAIREIMTEPIRRKLVALLGPEGAKISQPETIGGVKDVTYHQGLERLRNYWVQASQEALEVLKENLDAKTASEAGELLLALRLVNPRDEVIAEARKFVEDHGGFVRSESRDAKDEDEKTAGEKIYANAKAFFSTFRNNVGLFVDLSKSGTSLVVKGQTFTVAEKQYNLIAQPESFIVEVREEGVKGLLTLNMVENLVLRNLISTGGANLVEELKGFLTQYKIDFIKIPQELLDDPREFAFIFDHLISIIASIDARRDLLRLRGVDEEPVFVTSNMEIEYHTEGPIKRVYIRPLSDEDHRTIGALRRQEQEAGIVQSSRFVQGLEADSVMNEIPKILEAIEAMRKKITKTVTAEQGDKIDALVQEVQTGRFLEAIKNVNDLSRTLPAIELADLEALKQLLYYPDQKEILPLVRAIDAEQLNDEQKTLVVDLVERIERGNFNSAIAKLHAMQAQERLRQFEEERTNLQLKQSFDRIEEKLIPESQRLLLNRFRQIENDIRGVLGSVIDAPTLQRETISNIKEAIKLGQFDKVKGQLNRLSSLINNEQVTPLLDDFRTQIEAAEQRSESRSVEELLTLDLPTSAARVEAAGFLTDETPELAADQRQVAAAVNEIFETPASLARNEGIPLEEAIARVVRAILGADYAADETIKARVIDAVTDALKLPGADIGQGGQPVHAQFTAEAENFSADSIENTLYVFAALLIANPRDRYTVYISQEKAQALDININDISERFAAILRQLKAGTQLKEQLNIVPFSAVQGANLSQQIIQAAVESKRNNYEVAVISDDESLLKAIPVISNQVRIYRGLIQVVNSIVVTATALREQLTDNVFTIMDLEKEMDQLGLSGNEAAQRVAVMIQALKSIAAAA